MKTKPRIDRIFSLVFVTLCSFLLHVLLLQLTMALSCGKRRLRGKKGGGGSGSGRHFHVHYHLPRRVCASSFIPHLLPRFFSLLSACVLVPPVLFLAVLSFLTLFVWFTLLYFLRSLWNKDSNSESFERSNSDHGNDADKRQGEDVAGEGMAEKKALKISSELFSGDSAAAEDFAKWSKIEEVHVKSDESQNLLRMASSDGCLNCELHTDDEELIEEVIIFEIERGKPEAIASSDGLPERHHVQDLSIDWFEKEINSRDAIKSGDSSPTALSTVSDEFHDFSDKNEVAGLTMDFLGETNQNMAILLDTLSPRGIRDNHCKCGEELFDDKEAQACNSYENSDFIDKHETKEVVLDDCGNEDTVIVLACIDGSAHDGILYEHKEDNSEEKDPNNLPGLLNSVATLFDQQQEIKKVAVSDASKPPEVLFLNGKQIDSRSGELSGFPNENGTSGFPFDSICEDKNELVDYSSASSHYNIGIEDDKCEDRTDSNIEESSSTASTYCGSDGKQQNIQGVPDCLANGDNIDEVAPWENLICENVEDNKDKSNANCTSEGASHGNGMPLVRRSPAPWWNLCGVIDVFAGCED